MVGKIASPLACLCPYLCPESHNVSATAPNLSNVLRIGAQLERKDMKKLCFKLISAMVLYLCAAQAASAVEVRRCNGVAATDMLAAATFIDGNITTMVSQMTFLTLAQRGEILRKWPRFTLQCQSRNQCRNSGVAGHARSGPGNKVKICYDNMVDAGGQSLCTLMSVIVHEMGHANGFPIFRDHNNPSANTLANDLVYRMGNSALAFCFAAANAGTFNNAALRGTPRVALGQSCGRNPDCASGTCQRGICVCDEDLDCGGTRTCVKRGARSNICVATNLPRGAACIRDRQCASNRCRTVQRTCR